MKNKNLLLNLKSAFSFNLVIFKVIIVFLAFILINLSFSLKTWAKKITVTSADKLVTVSGSVAGVKIEQKSWKGDYMYDLLQHAPTSYAYKITAPKYSTKNIVELKALFPNGSESKNKRWRLYRKTSDKVGWLIVTKRFSIKSTFQTYQVILDRPQEFILVSDTNLLEQKNFDAEKPKEKAQIQSVALADRPLEGSINVSAKALQTGTLVSFGSVGPGKLDLWLKKTNAAKDVNIALENLLPTFQNLAEWRWIFSDDFIPNEAYFIWTPLNPTPGYLIEKAGIENWMSQKAQFAAENFVRVDLKPEGNLGFNLRWRVTPATVGNNTTLLLNQDSYRNYSLAFQVTPNLYQAEWIINNSGTAWSIKCGEVGGQAKVNLPTKAFASYALWSGTDPNNLLQDISVSGDHAALACNGLWQSIREEPKVFVGAASWYPVKLSSRAPNGFGAAMNLVPQNSWWTATNPTNNKTVTVKIVSTGPYAHGRLIDFTSTAFAKLASLGQGTIPKVILRPATVEEIKATEFVPKKKVPAKTTKKIVT